MTSHWSPDLLVNSNGEETHVPFADCLLDALAPDHAGINDLEVTHVYENEKLLLMPGKGSTLYHPSTCPLRKLSISQKLDLECKPIGCGAAVCVRSSDGFTLITRRAKTLRTFPGIWVPPGGHVEKHEDLEQTARRELEEEAGIRLNEEETMKLLCLFESCYPPFIESGLPRRRHIVFLYMAQCKREKSELERSIKVDEREVDAFMWLSDSNIISIVDQSINDLTDLQVLEVKNGRREPRHLQLYALSNEDSKERLSTSAKFALAVIRKML